MLNVTQDTTNTIIMTLTDDITLANTGVTGFTMNLINEYTQKEYNNIYLTDTSAYPNRYNKFSLQLTDEQHKDYSLAKVYLENNGHYKYNAYYYNSGATELLETGFMYVSEAFEFTFYARSGHKSAYGNTQIKTYNVQDDGENNHAVGGSAEYVIWSGQLTAGKRTMIIQQYYMMGYFTYDQIGYGSINPAYSNILGIYFSSKSADPRNNKLWITLGAGLVTKISIDGVIYKGKFSSGVVMTNPFIEGQTYQIKIMK
jgi:hypothetical protein